MKRIFIMGFVFLSLIGVLTFSVNAGIVDGGRPDIPSFIGYVPNKIVVKFGPQILQMLDKGALPSGKTGIPALDQVGITLGVNFIQPQFPGVKKKIYKGRVIDLAGWHKIKFAGHVNALVAVKRYKAIPGVIDAQPVSIHTVHVEPNDEFYSVQNNTQGISQWHLPKAEAPAAWENETGSPGITVAILDTGVRYYHKDLGGANASYYTPTDVNGNIWINWAEKNGQPGIDDDNNGYVDDWVGYDFVEDTTSPYQCFPGEDCGSKDNDPRDFHGHGTHCGGCVAAQNNNGYAVASLAGGWGNGNLATSGNGVKVMCLRIGWSAIWAIWEVGLVEMDYAAEALRYAADNGARIASCSWGSENTGGIADAMDYFIAGGGLIFKAAGNESTEIPDYIGSLQSEFIINVAATDQNDCKANFSNYGDWIEISAPGVNIWSLFHNHIALDPAEDYITNMDGTSMACPLSAAVAALIWSRNPSWAASQVLQQLYDSADNIDVLPCNASYIGKLGAGRINARKAVNTGTTLPVADFTGTPVSGCIPLEVSFNDQSSGVITSWAWDFGDETYSISQNPLHSYTNSGNYTVSLTVTGPGGSNTKIKTGYITVSEAPVADFTSNLTTGCAPFTVDFTDMSTGNPDSWNWDFGDGKGTSTEQNPSYTYEDIGFYTVTLTVDHVSCGSDIEVKNDYIKVDSSCSGVNRAFAISDIPVKGTVSGDYTNTYESSEGSYEMIREVISGGKPSNRYSMLEHKWNFNVTAGETLKFYVEAFRSNNSDGDNFRFEYSTDNTIFVPLLTVNSPLKTSYIASLPNSISGPIYIRVVDTDHNKGNISMDSVSIDYMYIISEGEPPPPLTMYVHCIEVTRIEGKPNRYQGQTKVIVYKFDNPEDPLELGAPLTGAKVSGHFSGPTNESVSGNTGADGSVTFISSTVRNPSGIWCFVVDNVELNSDVYDNSKNIETSDCEGGGGCSTN